MVATLGSIIPAPLTIPATRRPPCSTAISLGLVSVVMMARSASMLAVAIASQIRRRLQKEALDLTQIQVPAYDPGGCYADLCLIRSQKTGQKPGHGPGILQASRTGIGIGAAAVGYYPIQVAAGQVLGCDLQRRGSHPVGGEHASRSAGSDDQSQAVPSPAHSRRPHPGDGADAPLNPLHASSPDRR